MCCSINHFFSYFSYYEKYEILKNKEFLDSIVQPNVEFIKKL